MFRRQPLHSNSSLLTVSDRVEGSLIIPLQTTRSHEDRVPDGAAALLLARVRIWEGAGTSSTDREGYIPTHAAGGGGCSAGGRAARGGGRVVEGAAPNEWSGLNVSAGAASTPARAASRFGGTQEPARTVK